MRSEKELDGVSLLGNTKVDYPTQYAPEVLETFVNKHPDTEYLGRERRAGFRKDTDFIYSA